MQVPLMAKHPFASVMPFANVEDAMPDPAVTSSAKVLMPPLKVEVPENATPETPWRITRLSRRPYYKLTIRHRDTMEQSRVAIADLAGILDKEVTMKSLLKKLL